MTTKINPDDQFDYVIVGGGIVGLSVAWQLLGRQPQRSVLVIDKESALAQHQTGHNSGVIHAGVYYQPGSLKAEFCKRGAVATRSFCQQHHIAYRQCGKLLVATDTTELQRMQALIERCKQNGIEAQVLDSAQLQAMEPNIRGLGALHIPSSGIVDYRQISEAMATGFKQRGGHIRTATELLHAEEHPDRITLNTDRGPIVCQQLISCAGLAADRLCRVLGIAIDFSIIPFRGEYYRLSSLHDSLVKRLIYPIPDPALPFLGVHITPMIDGSITVGPNAVLGWKREGYGAINISVRDSIDLLRSSSFWNLLPKHLPAGMRELKNSLYKPGYLQRVRKYCPQLALKDLRPHPAGIRAQAVLNDGSLVHDFLFAESPRSLHVCNAPSPAATSAIPIGEYIVDKVLDRASLALMPGAGAQNAG